MLLPSPVRAAPDRWLGLSLLCLLVDRRKWLGRRNDRVEFLGDTRVRRHITIQCKIPDRPSTWPEDRPFAPALKFLPLVMIGKDPLVGYELLDEAGNIVPVPPWEQRNWAVWCALVVAAEGVLQQRLTPPLLHALYHFVCAPKALSLSDIGVHDLEEDCGFRGCALSPLSCPREVDAHAREDCVQAHLIKVLDADQGFAFLTSHVAHSSVLLVPVDESSPKHRAFQLAYDIALPWSRAQRREQLRHHQALAGEARLSEAIAVSARLAWKETTISIPSNRIGDFGTYHLEVAPPPGLELVRAELVGLVGRERVEHKWADPAFLPGCAHLCLRSTRAEDAEAVVGLGVTRRGVVSVALVTGLLISVVLTLGAWRPHEVLGAQDQADAAVALLVLVPGLVSTFIATHPSEHVIVSRLLWPLRCVLLALGGVSYLAATSIVLSDATKDQSPVVVRWLWAGGALVAWACALMALWSFRSTSEKRWRRAAEAKTEETPTGAVGSPVPGKPEVTWVIPPADDEERWDHPDEARRAMCSVGERALTFAAGQRTPATSPDLND